MKDRKFLSETLKAYKNDLTNDQLDKFDKYYDYMIKINESMNLTAITDYEDVVIKHFADSLSLSRIIDLKGKDLKVLDIGTGAGFPGIPLKIAYPKINITLLDSLNKRVDFLNNVIDMLNLNESGSISAVHDRAEDYIKNPGIRESYDLTVSRAVASLNILCEYSLPYLKEGGCFVSYKSENGDAEITEAENAIKILGGKTEKTESFTLPESDNKRTLILIKKICPTPEKYPRRAGVAVKKPIK